MSCPGKLGEIPHRNRALVVMLRVIGSLDLMAIIFLLAPSELVRTTHRWLGLGDFPSEPVAGYLARCASTWFAIYGLLLWFISFDIQKYSALIRFLAVVLLIQGAVIAGVDYAERMPTWWLLVEGLSCSGIGACMFWLQRRTFAED